MTRRTQTHITDTLAIREIMSKLPENWLVRGLEERDYGIDLSIELYNGENPTGCFALIQVKGTSKPFKNVSSQSLGNFPTKTLKYAQLFPEAFFIFHTSTVDKKTYFVWAQKYIELRLNRDNKGWEEQDTNTIYFPISNVLGTAQGNNKIEDIMQRLSAQQDGLKFLADFERLAYSWLCYAAGELDYIDDCIEYTHKLKRYQSFYDFYTSGSTQMDLHALTVDLIGFKEEPINVEYGIVTNEYDGDRCKDVESQLLELNIARDLFIHHRDRDMTMEDQADSPY